MPLGVVLAPFIAFLGFKALKEHQSAAHQGILYLLLTFAFSSLALLVIIKTTGNRFWLFMVPIYALLICASIASLADWFRAKDSYPTLHLGRLGCVDILTQPDESTHKV
jgi:hypothetical protein